jgi:acyl carrier protein
MDTELTALIERRTQILSVLRRILIEGLGVQRAPDEIDPDTPLFGSGLGLDSIDAVELLVSLETEFGIRLPDERIGRAALRSVNGLVDLVIAWPELSRGHNESDARS